MNGALACRTLIFLLGGAFVLPAALHPQAQAPVRAETLEIYI